MVFDDVPFTWYWTTSDRSKFLTDCAEKIAANAPFIIHPADQGQLAELAEIENRHLFSAVPR